MSTKAQPINIKGPGGRYASMADTGHQNIQAAFDQVVTPPPVMFDPVPNTPVALQNIPCAWVVIQNFIDNDPIYVGGLGEQTPYVDRNFPGDFRGHIVYPGVSYQFNVTNANLLQVVGTPYQMFQYKAYPNVNTVVQTDNTGPPEVDFTRPTVLSTSPPDAATNVPTSTFPYAIMSKAIDPASLSVDTFMISPDVDCNIFIDTGNTRIGCAPVAPLATSTTYTVTIIGGKLGIYDTAGPKNKLAADFSWSFTTIPTPDTTPPTVVSTVPVNGATSIDTLVSPTVLMSEPMLASTINNTNCRVLDGALANVAATVLISGDRRTITIDPTAALTNNVTYTIRITVAVKDQAGNALAAQFQSTFTTIAAPSVLSVTPVNAATAVSVSTTVTLVFSEAMDGTTINVNNVKLLDASLITVACNYTLSVDQKTVIMTPTAALLNSTVYTVRVTTGAKDLAGIALPSQFQSTFTTAASVPPTVSSVTPANAATSVALNASVTVVFSIAMLGTTINNTNMQLMDNNNASVPCTVTLGADGKTVTMVPASALTYSITYTVKVTTAVKSSANVALAAQFTSTFTTLAQSYTQIYNVSGSEYNTLGASDDRWEAELAKTSASTLINHTPRKVTVTLKKNGSPTGAIQCWIININAAEARIKQIGADRDASTLTGSDASYTFEDASNTQKITASGWGVGIRYAGGSSSNQVLIKRSGSEAYNGSDSIRIFSSDGTNWSEDSGKEFVATILE